MTLNKKQRYYIGKALVLIYQIIILPFAIVHVFLNLWHEKITDFIVGNIISWIKKGKDEKRDRTI